MLNGIRAILHILYEAYFLEVKNLENRIIFY
jgi:hypothetical protein